MSRVGLHSTRESSVFYNCGLEKFSKYVQFYKFDKDFITMKGKDVFICLHSQLLQVFFNNSF